MEYNIILDIKARRDVVQPYKMFELYQVKTQSKLMPQQKKTVKVNTAP